MVGEGEAILRAAFSTARSTAPSIIFIDELDTVAGSRSAQSEDTGGLSQLLTSLLTEIDGLENAEGEHNGQNWLEQLPCWYSAKQPRAGKYIMHVCVRQVSVLSLESRGPYHPCCYIFKKPTVLATEFHGN
jgi:SpoVK/Ycf46/Vps4 family AAA+-type ATPase